jgi:uncharacterized membrane protein YjdF
MIEKILAFLNAHLNGAPIFGFARDKIAHFVGGSLLAIFAAWVSYEAIPYVPARHATHVLQCFAVGAIFAASVGAIKEWIYDASHSDKHSVDPMDFVATSLGGVWGATLFGFLVVM